MIEQESGIEQDYSTVFSLEFGPLEAASIFLAKMKFLHSMNIKQS